MRRPLASHPYIQEAELLEDMIREEKRLASIRSSQILLTEDGVKRCRAEARELRRLARSDVEWLEGRI